VVVDDVKCSDQTFVQSVLNDEDLKSLSVSDRWIKYFQESCNADCHSELLKIAELFLFFPGHNANVERTLFMMNGQWTDKQNRLTTKAIKYCRAYGDYMRWGLD
jgi:hypothetical protein